MSINKPLSENIVIDDARDTVEIYGIKYSGALFRGLGFGLDYDKYFQIIKREDGVITLTETYAQPLTGEAEA